MFSSRIKWFVGALAAFSPVFCQVASAQEKESVHAWSSDTELSVVVAEGNAAAQTFGFKNTVRRSWDSSRLRARFDGVRSMASIERSLLVRPGVRFPTGGQLEDFDTVILEPDLEPDVEQYFVEGRFDRDITQLVFWNVGSSWDRNNEAGIRNRVTVFGGVGNSWLDTDDIVLSTSYGVSYTDREETQSDLLRDKAFTGIRISSDYVHQLSRLTRFDSDFTMNVNLAATTDRSINTTNAVGVSVNDYLSLRVSLQFLHEHKPSFEDVDVIARVALIDPDGISASGDELFETVAIGGTSINVGQGRVRKKTLDTVFRTALVISF
tara:strand:- start:86 stop:1054 length:969 start_codon:yes stop_codon:yes gene_type:complete